MRQDVSFHRGEAVSQRAVGQLFGGLFDRVVTVDAHLHRTPSLTAVFPNIQADNLSAVPAIAAALRSASLDRRTIIAGPDEESRARAGALAAQLGVEHLVGAKSRRSDRSVEVNFADAGAVRNRPVVLFDDIASSGGTITSCANALFAAGAAAVDVIVTHALFPPELVTDLMHGGIRSVRSTNSVPHPTNAFPLDEIIAAALKGEIEDTVSGA
jgi:ribose-phosphate pyrophosphokinase